MVSNQSKSADLFYFRSIKPPFMKTNKIIYWTLTGLVTLVFLGSASGKLMGNAEAVKMAEGFGINAENYRNIGIVELISLILFIWPRTGILGTILLSAYMGGAIATHVQHAQPLMAPCIVLSIVLAVAAYRFPELRQRLLNQQD